MSLSVCPMATSWFQRSVYDRNDDSGLDKACLAWRLSWHYLLSAGEALASRPASATAGSLTEKGFNRPAIICSLRA